MKSYSYARSLLGAVGFVVWLGFLAGDVMAYLTARSGSPLSIAVAVLAVVGVLISNVMALALVQVGHAIIDIAENTAGMGARGQLHQAKKEPLLRGAETRQVAGLRATRGEA